LGAGVEELVTVEPRKLKSAKSIQKIELLHIGSDPANISICLQSLGKASPSITADQIELEARGLDNRARSKVGTID
jgi:hypothetical protein